MPIDHINLARVGPQSSGGSRRALAERSVTKAAARIGIGQSAMSYNLARLRELFGDELLTRGPDGMRPTPRALALDRPGAHRAWRRSRRWSRAEKRSIRRTAERVISHRLAGQRRGYGGSGTACLRL